MRPPSPLAHARTWLGWLCVTALLLIAPSCQSPSSGRGGGGSPLPDFQVELVNLFPALTESEDDFVAPIALLQPPEDPTTWFIIQRGGEIWTINTSDTAKKTLFGTVPGVDDSGEGGLLGAAFHPDYPTREELFLSYTVDGSLSGSTGNPLDSRISRFDISGGALGAEDILIELDQPFGNHKGGDIHFGADGYLYIAFGDGGSGGDPENNAQNRATLLGKILRIDVSGTTGYTSPPDNPFFGEGGGIRNEIFAYGFRNPWRFSFDRANGIDLWLADVGQGDYEEVDFVVSGGNYGWRVMEGKHCFKPPTGCNGFGKILPVLEYSHSGGNCSISGGFVYRGTVYDALVGYYFYADYCSGRLFASDTASGRKGSVANAGFNIAGFGQGLDGELYVLDLGGGRIFHLVPAP